ncbi:MAG: polysaccharide biosynthesis tyrosine autokinase [Deltaproteobacteria bacterium]|nr:polysaccharide biosynthesis tyrosine autokinase [Deltaproteobacteria bacterium]
MTDPRDLGPAAPLHGPPSEETSLGEYLVILLDEWRTVALVFGVVMAAAAAYLLVAVPKYRASGVIQVSAPEGDSAMMFKMAGIERPSSVETEVEILRSRRIVGEAMRSLGLNIVRPIPPVTLDLFITLRGASPVPSEVKALRRAIRGLKIADTVSTPIEAEFKRGADGSLSVRLDGEGRARRVAPKGTYENGGVTFLLADAAGLKPGAAITANLVPDALAIEDLAESLSVENVGGSRTDTGLVRITFEDADRATSRDLVNAVMKAYMAFALEWRTMTADRSVIFIEGQLESIRKALEGSEKDLQAFVETEGAVLLPDQAKEMIANSAKLDLEYKKIGIQEEMLGMVAGEITRASKGNRSPALTGNFLFEDMLLGDVVGKLNELEMKREALLADMTETHPEVVRLTEEVRRLREQVLGLVKAARDRIVEQRRVMDRSQGEIQDRLLTFPDKERKMAMITRNMEVNHQLYTFLMTKLEEARILKASTTTDKRVIDGGFTPIRRAKPIRANTLVLAALTGILLGVGLAFARRALDPTVRDEEEAKSLSALPVYGVVPDLKLAGLERGKDATPDHIWGAPKGPGAEAFRTIRTNVEFAQVGDEPIRVIQITSAEASEGKSTVLANLAVALVKAGHRVLVVDLDLRRPVQHRQWGLHRSPGISDHLVGRAGLTPTGSPEFGVDVVPAGNEPPESQRLLASARLAELMASWRAAYDYVLLDTPPLLVADSLVASRLSDMVLFVVRPRRCRRVSLKLALGTLGRMNQVKGLVVNGVATRRGGYYHYYRGSYYGAKTSDTQSS